MKLGYDMVHWGTVISIACCVGMITPPFGNVLFTTMAVTDTKLESLTAEVREHNHFARRMPVVEEQIKVINHRIDDLEHEKGA